MSWNPWGCCLINNWIRTKLIYKFRICFSFFLSIHQLEPAGFLPLSSVSIKTKAFQQLNPTICQSVLLTLLFLYLLQKFFLGMPADFCVFIFFFTQYVHPHLPPLIPPPNLLWDIITMKEFSTLKEATFYAPSPSNCCCMCPSYNSFHSNMLLREGSFK